MITLYYFTGTGNSLYLARNLAKGLYVKDKVGLQPIQKEMVISKIHEEDTIGIIYPTYFLNAPDIIYQFIDNLKIPASTYVFLLTSCGGLSGNALASPYKHLVNKGHEHIGAFELILPDNSIIFPTPSEKEGLLLEEAMSRIPNIIKSILNKETHAPNHHKGHHLIGATIRRVTYHYHGFTQMKVDPTCNGCGTCVKVCVNRNISLKEKQPSFRNDCLMCFACIHYCPRKSITFKRMKTTNRNRYQNPYVSLKDLIETRNQSDLVMFDPTLF